MAASSRRIASERFWQSRSRTRPKASISRISFITAIDSIEPSVSVMVTLDSCHLSATAILKWSMPGRLIEDRTSDPSKGELLNNR